MREASSDRSAETGRRRQEVPQTGENGQPEKGAPETGTETCEVRLKAHGRTDPPHEKRHARALRGRREHRQRRLAAEETRPTATAGTTPRRRRQRIRPGRQTRPPGERS